MKLTIEVLKEIDRIEGLKESKSPLVGWMAKTSIEKYLTLESVKSFITDNDLWEMTETIEGCLLDDYFVTLDNNGIYGVAFLATPKNTQLSCYNIKIYESPIELENAYDKRYMQYLECVVDKVDSERSAINYLA